MEFENELREMLDSGNNACFGLDARFELWKAIELGDNIGPVLYVKDKAG